MGLVEPHSLARHWMGFDGRRDLLGPQAIGTDPFRGNTVVCTEELDFLPAIGLEHLAPGEVDASVVAHILKLLVLESLDDIARDACKHLATVGQWRGSHARRRRGHAEEADTHGPGIAVGRFVVLRNSHARVVFGSRVDVVSNRRSRCRPILVLSEILFEELFKKLTELPGAMKA